MVCPARGVEDTSSTTAIVGEVDATRGNRIRPHFCITAAIEPSGSVELVAGPATMEKPAVGAENFCSTGWLAAMLLAL
jgi:hypothetical protein